MVYDGIVMIMLDVYSAEINNYFMFFVID